MRVGPAPRSVTASVSALSPVAKRILTFIGQEPPSPSASRCSSVKLLMRPCRLAVQRTRTSGMLRRLTHASAHASSFLPDVRSNAPTKSSHVALA